MAQRQSEDGRNTLMFAINLLPLLSALWNWWRSRNDPPKAP